MIRRCFRFYGYVQGVGFRYTARHAAQRLGLTGFVRNEDDGTVTVELQGDASAIELFPELISNNRYIRIERWECTGLPLDEDERSFRVEYW